MIFTETILKGSFVIEPELVKDERGMFARIWCQKEFEAQGLKVTWVQSSISVNSRKGTLRGMHYQVDPHEEVKLVRCTMGAIYDVIVDLRPGSPTYRKWQAFELTAENQRQLYIPAGFAHGFQTLTEGAGVSYLISNFYEPSASTGVSYDDPALGIRWPLPVAAISDRDKAWALLAA